MERELQSMLGRLKRYDNIDGTGEMFMGLMILGFTLLAYLQGVVPKNSMWRHGLWGSLLMFLILTLVLGLGYWGVNAIKKHITWPRTGYVAFRSGGKIRGTRLAAAAAVGAIVGVCLIACLVCVERQHDWLRYGWSVKILCVAIYAFWVYHMERRHRWKWLLVLFMALALLAVALIARRDIARGDNWALLLPTSLLVAFTWLVSGGITLCSYVRHTQAPAPEAS
jgi:hypothetical protein